MRHGISSYFVSPWYRSEEDEDEDEAAPPPAENAEKTEATQEVKPEPVDPAEPPAPKANPYELQDYSEDEIDQMDPAHLKGEVAKLEGAPSPWPGRHPVLMPIDAQV